MRRILFHQETRVLGIVAVVLLVATSCGGDSTPDPSEVSTSTTSASSGVASSQVSTTQAVASTETTTKEPVTTTAEPGVTFASLSDEEQNRVHSLCFAATADREISLGDPAGFFRNVTGGFYGVPALEQAVSEIGPDGPTSKWFEAAAPICEDIGWTP